MLMSTVFLSFMAHQLLWGRLRVIAILVTSYLKKNLTKYTFINGVHKLNIGGLPRPQFDQGY